MFLVILLLLPCVIFARTIELSKTFLIDHSDEGHFIFRGNMPVGDVGYDWDDLLYVLKRKTTEAGLTFPTTFKVVDISLVNAIKTDERHALAVEQAFYQQHPELGSFYNWPLGSSGIVPPSLFTEEQRKQMSRADAQVWAIDQLPQRVMQLHDMLHNATEKTPTILYVHCMAGCDRTGLAIGAYRVAYQGESVQVTFPKACRECGRCPNYFSATGLAWYCYFAKYSLGLQTTGDCLKFSDCTPLKDCRELPPNQNYSNNNRDNE